MTKTAILSVTCAVALMIPGMAGAQYFDPDPYTGFYDTQERSEQRRQRQQRYEDAQRRALDEALGSFGTDPWVDEQRRQNEMDSAARFGCQSPGNPLAEAACLNQLR